MTHPQDIFWLTKSEWGVTVWRGKPTWTKHGWTGMEHGATIQAGTFPEHIFKLLCPGVRLRTHRAKRLGEIK